MNKKITNDQAKKAVRILIEWIGDDPNRAELLKTPERVLDAFCEYFSGYYCNIDDFKISLMDNENFDDVITLKNIGFQSYCEHHFVPFHGKATIAYIPDKKIIGLSKIAEIFDLHAKRLQIQERLIMEVANSLNKLLSPKGVAIIIEASHNCMTSRGIKKTEALMKTSFMLGCFKESHLREEFLRQAF